MKNRGPLKVLNDQTLILVESDLSGPLGHLRPLFNPVQRCSEVLSLKLFCLLESSILKKYDLNLSILLSQNKFFTSIEIWKYFGFKKYYVYGWNSANIISETFCLLGSSIIKNMTWGYHLSILLVLFKVIVGKSCIEHNFCLLY